jgi:RimJ/RimL family protein N-acetyltransferase
MKLVSCTDDVFAALQEAKRAATRYVTNLFPEPRKLEAWIARRELFEFSRGRAAVLLRRDADFFHLLFAAAEPAALVEGLQTLNSAETLVTDLIGRQAEVSELAACFETAGFRNYKSLQRLVWFRKSEQSFIADPEVVHATSEDAPQILAPMQNTFDRFAEQIPPLAEFECAADQKRILIIRNGAQLAGFLYFEPQGQAALIRYWFVSAACRGQGVGSKLMKTFFHLCPQARRVVLWVITTNQNAITKYDHYGFKPDGLLDQVMIKPNTV